MTGYGRGIYEAEGRSYTVEIKSVNHKYSDITIKLPRNLSFLEDKTRKEVQSRVNRGKIDIFVTFLNYSEKGKKIIINHELAKNYLKELNALGEQTGLENKVSVMDLARLPEVLTVENEDEEDVLWNELKVAVQKALDSFEIARKTEGEKIKEDLQLGDRIYECACGNRMDRDQNAAINICREGIRKSGMMFDREKKIC